MLGNPGQGCRIQDRAALLIGGRYSIMSHSLVTVPCLELACALTESCAFDVGQKRCT